MRACVFHGRSPRPTGSAGRNRIPSTSTNLHDIAPKLRIMWEFGLAEDTGLRPLLHLSASH